MDLIHLCLRAVRQEREQEFPRPVERFFSLTLVSCTYVTFHCLSEDFNVLLGSFFLTLESQSSSHTS